MNRMLKVKEDENMNINLTKDSDCLMINKREYLSQLSFDSSRIRQDKRIELDMKQEYSGRELYEMIQNADDEGSPKIELILTDDNHFHIKNWGNHPFTEGGLLSIVRSFLSTKRKESYRNVAVRPIGNKGLGFRSLLNWSDEISIHSNGVKCSFSEDIAKREWERIKEDGLKTGQLTLEAISDFEKERSNNLPLPILSIPKIEDDNITKQDCFDIDGACTTDVEVICKEQSVVSDIDSKLSSLPCSVLLFLKHINRIEINNKGQKRIIKKIGIELINNGFEKIIISDNDKNICFAVSKYQSDDRSFEVGVAYAMTVFNHEHYLYSYFPTQVRLTVPAIYHGTFELNASRNHLVNSEQNKIVLKKLGEVAVMLSENMVKYNLLNKDNWAPFNILNFTFDDIKTEMLFSLADSIKTNLKSAKILPRVNSTFSSIDSTIRLGDKLATWLLGINPEIYQDTSLSNHLISIDQKVFSSNRYLSDYVLSELGKEVNDIQSIARKKLLLEDRVNFIDAIVDCVQSKVSVLTDANGKIIEEDKDNPAYVLSMQGNTILPQCLSINAVDPELINKLQEKWNLQNIR
ncbi:MAG: sacsin N-terminal ATP-binding-like domain-containing protein, partial [Candidatus Cryptobacteroides sp.]